MGARTAPPKLAEWFAPRYPADGGGFYESFYLKANHPSRKLALWLKFNLFEARGGAAVGEVRAAWFDGESGEHVVGEGEGEIELEAGRVRIGAGELRLSGGRLEERAAAGALAWEVGLLPEADPIVHLPWPRLYTGGFPKKKIVTPVPLGRLEGWIGVEGRREPVDGWRGLFGHNWGREHARAYAYGNAAFTDGALFDGFSARVALGPVSSPPVSIAVLRLPSGEELRFDAARRWLSGSPRWGAHHWRLSLPGARGTLLKLSMEAPERDFVELVYCQPGGGTGLCLNTKFARCAVRAERGARVLYDGETESAELETFSQR
jgi:hypothetical protein